MLSRNNMFKYGISEKMQDSIDYLERQMSLHNRMESKVSINKLASLLYYSMEAIQIACNTIINSGLSIEDYCRWYDNLEKFSIKKINNRYSF